jgi:tellurite resistance protein
MTSSSESMDKRQAEAFAQGLYYLASVDGIDEREIQLIRDFLAEVGHPDLIARLSAEAFDLETAVRSLTTSFIRQVFLRTAIALVQADGTVSQEERFALRTIAKRFGLEANLDTLLAEPVASITE